MLSAALSSASTSGRNSPFGMKWMRINVSVQSAACFIVESRSDGRKEGTEGD